MMMMMIMMMDETLTTRCGWKVRPSRSARSSGARRLREALES